MTPCHACQTVLHCQRKGCIPLVPLSQAPKPLFPVAVVDYPKEAK